MDELATSPTDPPTDPPTGQPAEGVEIADAAAALHALADSHQGQPWWSARALARLYGYPAWWVFDQHVIPKATARIAAAGYDPTQHLVPAEITRSGNRCRDLRCSLYGMQQLTLAAAVNRHNHADRAVLVAAQTALRARHQAARLRAAGLEVHPDGLVTVPDPAC